MTACRRPFRFAVLAGAVVGPLALAAAPGAARAEREHVNFNYQKIVWSTETAKNASVRIRNAQPPARPPPGDALADLPQAPHGRIPPHTPDIALKRGASPQFNPEQYTISKDNKWAQLKEGGATHFTHKRPGRRR